MQENEQILVWVPGAVFYCKYFEIGSANKGRYIISVISQSLQSSSKKIIFLTCTSQQKRRNLILGCHLAGRSGFESYCFPKGSVSSLPLDTWVQLNKADEIEYDAFERLISAHYVYEKTPLNDTNLISLLECATKSKNIDSDYIDIIKQTLATLPPPSKGRRPT